MEFDATVTLPSPAHDAITGQTTRTLVLDEPPIRYAVEAGYDAAGAFVFNQYALDPPGDPLTQSVNPARTISVHDSRFELLDAAGEPILGTGSGNGPSLQTAMDAPSSEALQIVDEIVLSKAPLTGTTSDLGGTTVSVTNVSQTGDMVTVQAQISSSEPGVPTLPQQRIYRKTTVNGAEQLTLIEARMSVVSNANGTQISGQAVMRIDGLQVSRNAARDAQRRNGTAPSAFGTTPSNIGPYIPNPCDPNDYECEPPDPTGNGQGNTGNNGGGNSNLPGCGFVAGGPNLAFVHGIQSNGSAWGDPAYDNRIRGRTRCGLAIGGDIAPTLPQGAHFAVQSEELRSAVLVSGHQQNIFIAHSQGGLISRRTAQRFASDHHPEYVQGIITIGTPHQGANIARNIPTGVTDVLEGLLSRGLTCRITGSCNVIREGFIALRETVLSAAVGASSADALYDLRPGSQALAQTNSVAEGPLFPNRYGIRHLVNHRWTFSRVAGDAISSETGRGPLLVGITGVLYYGSIGVGIITFFTGHWGVAAICARLASAIRNTQNWWDRITAGNQSSDGVVEGASQTYPGANFNFDAQTPTSHTGEIDTPRSYVEINKVLASRFSVVRRRPL